MTTATSTIPNPATWGPRRYEDDLDPIEVRELAITAGERRVHVIQNAARRISTSTTSAQRRGRRPGHGLTRR